jgi:hypothetical protein
VFHGIGIFITLLALGWIPWFAAAISVSVSIMAKLQFAECLFTSPTLSRCHAVVHRTKAGLLRMMTTHSAISNIQRATFFVILSVAGEKDEGVWDL